MSHQIRQYQARGPIGLMPFSGWLLLPLLSMLLAYNKAYFGDLSFTVMPDSPGADVRGVVKVISNGFIDRSGNAFLFPGISAEIEVVTSIVGKAVRGGSMFGTQNETLATTLETAAGVFGKKLAEHEGFCYFEVTKGS